MRLLVYTDYVYARTEEGVFAQRAFALFLARLRAFVPELTLAGRLDPQPQAMHYRLPDDVRFVALPHYESLARPFQALPAMVRSFRRFWRALAHVDAVWILGPYPLSFVFVALAALRRRRVVLGVRQDWPRYVISRHPDRRALHLVAHVMEAGYRLLARRYPIIVVGDTLAHNYRHARATLPIAVSTLDEADIADADAASDGESLIVLTVGRLETEKNPLLLAEILERLRSRDTRWRLVVVGEGPLRPELEQALERKRLSDHAELLGYVPLDRGLLAVYRNSDFFLHVSWTEGLPQVILEAFAARLPVVATRVGGVEAATDGAALLIPPGDGEAAASSLTRLADDDALRQDLVARGLARVRARTITRECERIVAFIRDPNRG